MEYIDDLRRDPEVKEAYMHWEVFIQSERDEAREEERVKTRIEVARADAAESRASAAERNALAAENRASAVEEELERMKAAFAAFEKKYRKSVSQSI